MMFCLKPHSALLILWQNHVCCSFWSVKVQSPKSTERNAKTQIVTTHNRRFYGKCQAFSLPSMFLKISTLNRPTIPWREAFWLEKRMRRKMCLPFQFWWKRSHLVLWNWPVVALHRMLVYKSKSFIHCGMQMLRK